ncbi:MAG: fasciclin domain-containing protein [Lacinutrix venerupis]
MKNLKKISLALLAITLFWSCSDDDDATSTVPVTQPLNIVETAQATPSLSVLVDAVIQAGLVDALSADGERTVFAPTNAAFTSFLQAKGFSSLSEVPNDVLTQILLNHVIADSNITSTALANSTGYATTMASGPNNSNLSIFYNGNSGVQLNGVASVTTADVSTTNGIVHIVDEVIDLPTVTTFAVADPNFDTLQEALTTLTPQTDFASILARIENNADNINPDFTVFAPTNDAFSDITIPTDETVLTNILLHHVISGANVRSTDLTPNGDTTAPSLEGDNITVTLPGTGSNIADVTDGSGNTDIGIIAVDVQATNGVIHAVNKVLLPM